MATRDIAHGAEGKATFKGIDWEVTDLNVTENTDEQVVTCTSEYDATDNVVYHRSVTTGKRLTGSFTLDFDKNKPIHGSLASGEEEVVGEIQIYSGQTITGTFRIGDLALQANGMTGVWGVTVPFSSQGKYTIS